MVITTTRSKLTTDSHFLNCSHLSVIVRSGSLSFVFRCNIFPKKTFYVIRFLLFIEKHWFSPIVIFNLSNNLHISILFLCLSTCHMFTLHMFLPEHIILIYSPLFIYLSHHHHYEQLHLLLEYNHESILNLLLP